MTYKIVKNFVVLNSINLLISYLSYRFLVLCGISIFSLFLLELIKKFFFIKYITHGLADKKFLCEERRIIPENKNNKFTYHVIYSSLLCSLCHMIFFKYYKFNETNILMDILYFIPNSFIFEIIYDFFYYWTHRALHANKYLYKKIHKKHHEYIYPIPILAFYMHPLDNLLSNIMPFIITLTIIPRKSLFTILMILVYKLNIEVVGHSGKKINTSSFPQMFLLPKLLNIELYVNDHDKHHIYNNHNYSKRFSLWDKVFGTYKQDS